MVLLPPTTLRKLAHQDLHFLLLLLNSLHTLRPLSTTDPFLVKKAMEKMTMMSHQPTLQPRLQDSSSSGRVRHSPRKVCLLLLLCNTHQKLRTKKHLLRCPQDHKQHLRDRMTSLEVATSGHLLPHARRGTATTKMNLHHALVSRCITSTR